MNCFRCSSCKRKEIVKQNCSSKVDTKCGCPPGHVYHPHRPCKICPTGTSIYKNRCVNGTATPTAITTTSTGQPKSALNISLIAIISASVIVSIIFIVLVYKLSIYLRRRSHEQHIVSSVVKQKAPAAKQNDYDDVPAVGRPQSPTHVYGECSGSEATLSGSSLPFSLVHDLTSLLSARYSTNYKDLAGALGFTYDFVRNLEMKDQPVECLLDHYLTTVNPTKKALCDALSKIHRHDVAQKVWAAL